MVCVAHEQRGLSRGAALPLYGKFTVRGQGRAWCLPFPGPQPQVPGCLHHPRGQPFPWSHGPWLLSRPLMSPCLATVTAPSLPLAVYQGHSPLTEATGSFHPSRLPLRPGPFSKQAGSHRRKPQLRPHTVAAQEWCGGSLSAAVKD